MSEKFFANFVLLALLVFATFVYGQRELSPPVDCQKMLLGAPFNTPWVPQCDEKNQLTALQVKKDGSKFCVDKYLASVLLDATPEMPDISCECLTEATELRRSSSKPMYVAQCDPHTGAYYSKQCNRRKECWCVDASGRQLGPKWGDVTRLTLVTEDTPALQAFRVLHPQPRPNCEMIAKYFNSWTAPAKTQPDQDQDE